MQEGVIRAFPPAGTSKALFLPVHSMFLVSLFRNKSKTERKAVLPDTAKSVRAQQNLLPSNISLNKLIFVVCYQNIVWRQGQRVQFIGTQPSLKINIREIQSVGWHYLCPHLQHRSNAEDDHALAAERLGEVLSWGLLRAVLHCSSAPPVWAFAPAELLPWCIPDRGTHQKKNCSDDMPADCPDVLYNQLNYRTDK